jgi:hypothetical protein
MMEADLYSGLDGAVADTEKPYLEPGGNYVVEVTNIKVFNGRTSNETLLIEYQVIESDVPTMPPGATAKYMVTDYFARKDPDNKAIKLRNLIGVLAALANKDPATAEQWGQVAKYASDTQCYSRGCRNAQGQLLRGGRGVLLRVKTGPMKRSKKGYDFAPHFFSHVEG